MESTVLLSILGLAVEHGIPAVQKAVVAMNKTEITAQDVEELHALVKKPEEYLK